MTSAIADWPGSRLRAWRMAIVAFLIVFGPIAAAHAQDAPQEVRASDRVTHNVVVRTSPTTASAPRAALPPGDTLPFSRALSGWYEVRLPDGSIGYVSRSWTVLVPAPVAPPVAAVAGPYEVEAADVGTGLAVLVTGPGFALLYDGGSNDDLATGGGNRLVAFLRATHPALRRIDHVVLSHPHQDHVQLLADVIDAYEVGDVWDSGRLNPICGYRAFLDAITRHPTIVYHDAIADGGSHVAAFAAQTCNGRHLTAETISLPRGGKVGSAVVALGAGAALTFLHEDPAPYTDVNRNSLVARIDLGLRRLLLMGDAGGGDRADPANAPKPDSVEGQLLACCLAALRADVMVVGHHGSETSSRQAFVDAVGAHDFIVSVGPKAYSGTVLPDAVIVHELEARGRLWRTDLDDASCGAAQKVGRDGDGQPGGCDNVRVIIDAAGVVTADYERLVD